MDLAVVKHFSGVLVPDGPPDEEFVRRLRTGDVIVGKFTKPRNGGHHRKLFALLTLMYESQERFPNMTAMLVDLKVKTGHYDHHVTPAGEVVYVPRSISYGEMDQSAFEPFYSRVVDLALADPTYLRGMSADALANEINRRLNFA